MLVTAEIILLGSKRGAPFLTPFSMKSFKKLNFGSTLMADDCLKAALYFDKILYSIDLLETSKERDSA